MNGAKHDSDATKSSDRDVRSYPDELLGAELTALKKRRDALPEELAAGVPAKQAPVDVGAAKMPPDTVGVALSGGGIRSATFCLGVFQALARHGLIRQIDFLSTVSGGGYFGGFLGRLFTRPWVNDPRPVSLGAEATQQERCDRPDDPADAKIGACAPGVPRVEEVLKTPASPPMRWLRDHGRYLSPNDAGDFWLLLASVLRNWVAVTVVWTVGILTVFLLMNAVRAALAHWDPGLSAALEGPFLLRTADRLWWSPWLYLPAGTFLLLVLPFGLGYWLTPQTKHEQPVWRDWALPFAACLLAAMLLYLWGLHSISNLPIRHWLATLYPSAHIPVLSPLSALAVSVPMLAICFWCCYWVMSKPKNLQARKTYSGLSHALTRVFGITLALLVMAVVDSLGQTLYGVARVQGWNVLTLKTLCGAAGITSLAALAKRLGFLFELAPGKSRPVQLSLNALAVAAALLLLGAALVGLSAVGHGFLWGWQTPNVVVNGHAVNPGQNVVTQYVSRATVALSAERFIRVDESVPSPSDTGLTGHMHGKLVGTAAVVALLFSFVVGRAMIFLNLSSHHWIYSSRLAEAYLGASNPNRWLQQQSGFLVDCDDTPLDKYRPHDNGGPLHLINVTVNETVSGKTRLEYRDRKGFGMVIGPCGISAADRFHALWPAGQEGMGITPLSQKSGQGEGTRLCAVVPSDAVPRKKTEHGGEFQLFVKKRKAPRGAFQRVVSLLARKEYAWDERPRPVEPLTLRQWVGISGAAFTTGLGAQTSLGKSLLLGLFNIRLGYWWNSGIAPGERQHRTPPGPFGRLGEWLSDIFPMQSYLIDEFLARFHGSARKRWYLSDGGHFENTGCYELIRRRVPFIVVCDDGQDTESAFENLANLGRKLRIDFRAELRFLTATEIQTHVRADLREYIGVVDDLKRAPKPPEDSKMAPGDPKPGHSQKHATLAWVEYPERGARPSLILFIKPTLTGDEPVDLLNYQAANPDFPQQPTYDQYFDEAQWESYRKLGEHIAWTLFSAAPGAESSLKAPSSASTERDKWIPRKMRGFGP